MRHQRPRVRAPCRSGLPLKPLGHLRRRKRSCEGEEDKWEPKANETMWHQTMCRGSRGSVDRTNCLDAFVLDPSDVYHSQPRIECPRGNSLLSERQKLDQFGQRVLGLIHPSTSLARFIRQNFFRVKIMPAIRERDFTVAGKAIASFGALTKAATQATHYIRFL